MREYSIQTIYNGIDLNLFKPLKNSVYQKYNIDLNKKIILGVANIWTQNKGLKDFIKLSHLIDKQYQILLVGLSDSQIHALPQSIIGINRTNTLQELIEIYSAAYVYVNPSIEETLGLTTAEALACGTPVITYNKTAVPEVPDESCGIVVDCKPESIVNALPKIQYISQENSN